MKFFWLFLLGGAVLLDGGSPTRAAEAPLAESGVAAKGGPESGATPGPSAPPSIPPLPQTMTLTVQGNLTQTLSPVDLALAVSGPEFAVSTSLEAKSDVNRIRLSFSGTVQLVGEKYLVNYALRWEVPVSSMYLGGTPTVTYHNLGVEGAALLRAGQPVTILDDQGKKLTLSIKFPEKSAAPAPAPGH